LNLVPLDVWSGREALDYFKVRHAYFVLGFCVFRFNYNNLRSVDEMKMTAASYSMDHICIALSFLNVPLKLLWNVWWQLEFSKCQVCSYLPVIRYLWFIIEHWNSTLIPSFSKTHTLHYFDLKTKRMENRI